LHFEDHRKLSDHAPTIDYLWVLSGLHPANQKVVAELCKDISLKNAADPMQIPYGFRFDGNYFDVTGSFIGHFTDNGLTCATFILAVFRTLSLELLDVSEWPLAGDVEDNFFQFRMTQNLAFRGDEIRKALENQHGSPRFRPEQVAAGSGSKTIPLKYDAALKLGREILDIVKKAKAKANHPLPP
jgi:hypothetical protein